MKYDEIIKDHLPASSIKRLHRKMVPQYLTVHNTGNPKSTARNERDYLTNPTNKTTTAYHIVVDAKQAIECIPLDEMAYHAGDGKSGTGNSKSIGIEICESGDYGANERAAIELIADLLIQYGWDVDRVKPHKHWSRKNCPRLILPYWDEFVERIAKEMELMKMAEVQDWQLTAIREVCDRYKLDKDYWLAKAGQALTVGELFGILNKVAR
ncbi:MAG: N-acetylmuramoyl-L-alanine amidase [Muribaculaceae bacterium]|nr:N-acetylmuramoyl-L-alanine amidase [Muribaculaceae bacterium]